MEMLLDSAYKVQKLWIWDNINHIRMLYEDGTHLEQVENVSNLQKYNFDFIKKVYKEVRGNKFFDRFIKENYHREISIWQHRRKSQKELVP